MSGEKPFQALFPPCPCPCPLRNQPPTTRQERPGSRKKLVNLRVLVRHGYASFGKTIKRRTVVVEHAAPLSSLRSIHSKQAMYSYIASKQINIIPHEGPTWTTKSPPASTASMLGTTAAGATTEETTEETTDASGKRPPFHFHPRSPPSRHTEPRQKFVARRVYACQTLVPEGERRRHRLFRPDTAVLQYSPKSSRRRVFRRCLAFRAPFRKKSDTTAPPPMHVTIHARTQ